nr:hypothetical protein [Ardenticatenales bacterium]
MSLGAVGNIFNTIRQLDLNAIKKDAERRVTLLVAGEPELAQTLAVELSTAPGKEGVHPWIIVQPLPLAVDTGDMSQYHLALIVLGELDMNEGQHSALRRLHDAKVPVIVVIVNEAAQTQVGADLPRPREAARVLLPPGFDEVTLQSRLAPALLQSVPSDLK